MHPYFILSDITSPYFWPRRKAASEIEYDQITHQWKFAVSGEVVRPGRYLYVMDPSGRLFIGLKRRFLHHSSFVRGGRVSAAGEFEFGQLADLVSADNYTGHYHRGFEKPCLPLRQLLSEFVERKVNISKFKLVEYKIDMDMISMMILATSREIRLSDQQDFEQYCRDVNK